MSFRLLSNTFLAVALVLLSLMRPSGDTCLHPSVNTPRAWNTEPLRSAPLVEITLESIRCSGAVVADTRDVARGAPHALDELEAVLEASRRDCSHPGEPCAGIVTFDVDRRIQTGVLKAVLASAVRTGHTHHDFATERWIAMSNTSVDER